jgi:replication initiation protein RepC
MAYACSPGAGFRRFDNAAAEAGQLADSFKGLPEGKSPANALAAFKRAASYMQVPPSIVHLVDVMFAWTRAEDWQAGSSPIVWPRNEKLAQKLGLSVRQVQNLLDRAVRLRLITHLDSPNGHRGGSRAADGTIKWAYGIVLSPIGARMAEFTAIAQRGAEEDARIDALKKRLSAARRRISSLAKTAIDQMLPNTGADEELALALSATRQMRAVRDIELLTGCVEQIEQRGRQLERTIAEALQALEEGNMTTDACGVSVDIASSDAADCTHSTTTRELQSAKAVTGNGLARRSSGEGVPSPSSAASVVEDDLEKYGVDPDFIESVAPNLCFPLKLGRHGWGDVIHLAERLVDQNGIHRHAWHEARRLMGDRGAAASVIATVQKYMTGEVHRPGAYLRGMSERAARGELHLGRTYHGLKDGKQAVAMRAMHNGDDPRSVGEIARRAVSGLVLSGRPSR